MKIMNEEAPRVAPREETPGQKPHTYTAATVTHNVVRNVNHSTIFQVMPSMAAIPVFACYNFAIVTRA